MDSAIPRRVYAFLSIVSRVHILIEPQYKKRKLCQELYQLSLALSRGKTLVIFGRVRYAHTMYESPPPQPTTPAAKHRMFFTLALIVFLIIGVGCFIWWQASDSVVERRERPLGPTTPTQSANSFDANTIISTLETQMPGKKLAIVDAADGSRAYSSDKTVVYTTVPRQPQGYDFRILPSESFGFQTTGDRELADRALDDVKNFFETYNFDLVSEQIGEKSETTHATLIYTSDRASCLVTEQTVTVSRLSVGCADESAYQASAAQFSPAHKIQPKTEDISEVAYGVPRRSLGAQDYARLEVPQYRWQNNRFANNESTALFYQSPTGTWHYFDIFQTTPACDRFTSQTLKNAFKGTRCLEADGSSTIL